MSRLRDLKDFHWRQDQKNQTGLQKFMKLNQPCDKVTRLSFGLGRVIFEYNKGFQNNDDDKKTYAGYNEDISIEDNDNNDSAPFFNFSAFPNLQKLAITISDSKSYPLGLFVIEGFKCLQGLRYLTLLHGLINLPLLASFKFEVLFLRENEKSLLAKFLQKQTQLIFLFLYIIKSSEYKPNTLAETQYIDNIIHYIDNKPNLKYLTLLLYDCPIELYSKSLKKISMMNKLKELKIETLDDFEYSCLPPRERVKGLCDFIQKQKLSLEALDITVKVVSDDDVVSNLIMTISELNSLNTLIFNINADKRDHSMDSNFTEKVLLDKVVTTFHQGILSFAKTSVSLEQALRTLTKLSLLTITLASFFEPDRVNIDSLTGIFNALPNLNNLRNLSLYLPLREDVIDIKSSQVMILVEVARRASISIETSGFYYSIKEIEERLKLIPTRQYLLKSLTFSKGVFD